MEWRWMSFYEMTPAELYEALKLRQDVFVLEQRCVYPELDGLDALCLHCLGRDGGGRLAAYLRIVPPGARFEEPSIGRVVTTVDARGRGIGRALVGEGVRKTREEYPKRAIRISAQRHLEGFYGGLGFRAAGEPYDEAGIEHVQMVLEGE